MKTRLTCAFVMIAIVVIAALWPRPEPPPKASAAAQSIPSPTAPPAKKNVTVVSAAPAPTTPADATTADSTGTFHVDHAGKLVIDEQTRLAMEALFARSDPADLPEAQEEITRQLPPAAAQEASVLLDRYQNYSQAQRQAYPPGAAPATEEAALAELDGLHALRVAHFGPEVAQALYGAEEALTRSLIELMRLEKNQGLTLEEKAARAQQLYDTLPELSRAQRSN